MRMFVGVGNVRVWFCVVLASALFLVPSAAALTTWTDPVDVSLPNADMVSGSATVFADTVYLRVRFDGVPLFGASATHFIDWCIDRDQGVTTDYVCGGVPGGLYGSDASVSIQNVGIPIPNFWLGLQGSPPTILDWNTNYEFDAVTNTVCVSFPHSMLQDDDDSFNYIITSTFGGSHGANDWAPDNPTSASFFTPGGYFTSESVNPGPCGGSPPTKCPLSHGFWKNHEEAWPVTSLQLGSETYNRGELLSLLRSPSLGDASLILAHQFIAAKLNIANGADAAPITAIIQDADTLLSGLDGRLPLSTPASTTEGQQMASLASTLDDYNHGALTPDCRALVAGSTGDLPHDSRVLPPPQLSTQHDHRLPPNARTHPMPHRESPTITVDDGLPPSVLPRR